MNRRLIIIIAGVLVLIVLYFAKTAREEPIGNPYGAHELSIADFERIRALEIKGNDLESIGHVADITNRKVWQAPLIDQGEDQALLAMEDYAGENGIILDRNWSALAIRPDGRSKVFIFKDADGGFYKVESRLSGHVVSPFSYSSMPTESAGGVPSAKGESAEGGR